MLVKIGSFFEFEFGTGIYLKLGRMDWFWEA